MVYDGDQSKDMSLFLAARDAIYRCTAKSAITHKSEPHGYLEFQPQDIKSFHQVLILPGMGLREIASVEYCRLPDIMLANSLDPGRNHKWWQQQAG